MPFGPAVEEKQMHCLEGYGSGAGSFLLPGTDPQSLQGWSMEVNLQLTPNKGNCNQTFQCFVGLPNWMPHPPIPNGLLPKCMSLTEISSLSWEIHFPENCWSASNWAKLLVWLRLLQSFSLPLKAKGPKQQIKRHCETQGERMSGKACSSFRSVLCGMVRAGHCKHLFHSRPSFPVVLLGRLVTNACRLISFYMHGWRTMAIHQISHPRSGSLEFRDRVRWKKYEDCTKLH